MSASDYRGKDTAALQESFASKRESLAELIREKRVSEKGDVNRIKKTRKEIAQILTVINEVKQNEESK